MLHVIDDLNSFSSLSVLAQRVPPARFMMHVPEMEACALLMVRIAVIVVCTCQLVKPCKTSHKKQPMKF